MMSSYWTLKRRKRGGGGGVHSWVESYPARHFSLSGHRRSTSLKMFKLPYNEEAYNFQHIQTEISLPHSTGAEWNGRNRGTKTYHLVSTLESQVETPAIWLSPPQAAVCWMDPITLVSLHCLLSSQAWHSNKFGPSTALTTYSPTSPGFWLQHLISTGRW